LWQKINVYNNNKYKMKAVRYQNCYNLQEFFPTQKQTFKGIESLPQTHMFLSLQPNGVNLWYFKLRLFDRTNFVVWNIQGLRHWVAQI